MRQNEGSAVLKECARSRKEKIVMSYASYRLPAKVKKQERPAGVAILAIVGVLGGLAAFVLGLLGLWMRQRLGIALGGPSIGLALMTVLGLLVLWANWGLWEMVGWAWWTNLFLTILAIVWGGMLFRYLPSLAASLAPILPKAVEPRIALGVGAGATISLVYNIITAIYLLMVRTTFGVGVKDERPLWERQHRN
jgi:hypothetical protein